LGLNGPLPFLPFLPSKEKEKSQDSKTRWIVLERKKHTFILHREFEEVRGPEILG
jgi:hypothetical protein